MKRAQRNELGRTFMFKDMFILTKQGTSPVNTLAAFGSNTDRTIS